MSILLTNLDMSITSTDLKEFLLQFGLHFHSVEVIFDKRSGKSMGKAIVEFDSEEDGNRLLKNIYVIKEKQIEAQILKNPLEK